MYTFESTHWTVLLELGSHFIHIVTRWFYYPDLINNNFKKQYHGLIL